MRALCSCLIISVFALWATQAPAEDATPLRLRILCYNIQHGAGSDGELNLARQAEVIRQAKPDLVALQEVDHRTMRTNQVDQVAELAKLTQLHGRFARQIDYEGGEYGQGFLSRFPIEELHLHVLPGMPERERRLAAEIHVRVGGEQPMLSFVSTHLHHLNEQFRQQQAERLNELFANAPHPVILAGDLNANPDSIPLEKLRQHWLVAGEGQALRTYPAAQPTKQIDYVLVRPASRGRIVSAEVLDKPLASDHRPLLVVVELVEE